MNNLFARRNPLQWLMILILRCYRKVISPLYGPVCKFYPSCSTYALEAVEEYGFFQGSYLAVRRLLRCHPWQIGGIDPVPGTETKYHYVSNAKSEV